MKKLLLIFLLLPFIASSQGNPSMPEDSLRYFQTQLAKLRRESDEALRNSQSYKAAIEGIERYKRNSNSYSGLTIFSGIVHTDYRSFNKSIQQSGFPKMKAISTQVGFGISTKVKRTMIDLYFAVVGTENESKKDEEVIRTSLLNIFQFDLGHNLVKSKSFALFPYVGLSYRGYTLEYIKPAQPNPNYTNITDLIINDPSIETTSNRVGYHAGIGIDIVIDENLEQTVSRIFFIKAGINRPVWKDKFKVEGIKYDPGIKVDWLITFGVKFANKSTL